MASRHAQVSDKQEALQKIRKKRKRDHHLHVPDYALRRLSYRCGTPFCRQSYLEDMLAVHADNMEQFFVLHLAKVLQYRRKTTLSAEYITECAQLYAKRITKNWKPEPIT